MDHECTKKIKPPVGKVVKAKVVVSLVLKNDSISCFINFLFYHTINNLDTMTEERESKFFT